MTLAVLTTETTHHAYFIRELNRSFPIAGALVEKEVLVAPFETRHPFEQKREVYERKVFFGGKTIAIRDLVPAQEVASINDDKAITWLKGLKPDVVVVFGTGKIGPQVIRACRGVMLNLHGGDPREYRGLDSHLWAIYHKRFDGLFVTLHKVNAVLDDGAIVGQEPIRIVPEMKIHELRRYNTEICIRLAKKALKEYKKRKAIASVQQKNKGRYYSFMPSCLKEIAVDHFDRYVRSLR